MIDKKIFNGLMDTDSSPYTVEQGSHVLAKNIRFPMQGTFLQAQNVKGNYVIANSNLPGGRNEAIGSFFDQVNDLIYWFNWNEYGAHGIYKLDIQTETITQIFRCFVNSTTDILNFSLDYPVHSAALVYRTTGDGDLLYWTDGNNRPRYLNLATVSALSPFSEEMINAAKLPPLVPPANVSYNSDAAFSANRVKNKYFQFSYRWVYNSLEKSTFSPWSIVPIPTGIVYPNADINTNTNNYIEFLVISGATEDFESIEIAGRTWLGAGWSDFFLIQTVTKDDIATPLPFAYTVKFYNNGNYSPITPDETDLYYDYLPNKANTLELLNGNVLIYGGLTEGYHQLTRQEVDVQLTTSTVNSAPAPGVDSYPSVIQVWKWSQYQRLGLQYFDKWSKPIGGVISYLADALIDTTNFDITTNAYSSEVQASATYPIPKISSVINHVPPQNAESYCWVRADLTPTNFLYWVTNDYQQDTEYLYFCIQSLIDANANNGLLPSYEFAPGDRLRAIAQYVSNETTSVFVPQLDFQVLEVVQKVMANGNPAQNGAFVKVKRPLVFPTAYPKNTLIEIYTPPVGLTDENILFYEWSQRYGFQTIAGIKYHLGGTQNQTASLPALTEWTNGDVYLKSRQIYPTIAVTGNFVMVMDRRYNDFQESAANSNGRAWVIDPNAKEEYNGVLVRWGGKYQAGTNINNLNRFRPSDFDEADRGKGDIRRFKARDRILRAFQDRGVGQWGIYARFIQNNAGEPELVTTNEIITVNNIQYYQGVYGLCGYPTNLASSTIADYFTDIITGRAIRLSGDGMTDLGVLYKGQYYFPSLVLPYNKQLLRSNGSIAKVMAFFDGFDNQYHTILQDTTTTDPYNFAFNEDRNGFVSIYDLTDAEWFTHANGVNYQWHGGYLYKQDSDIYCQFFGVQYDAEIDVVFNRSIDEKKYWLSLTETASDIFSCPEIYTDTLTYPGQRQQTNLVAAEFQVLEGKPSSSIKRDSFSPGGKINGQFLKGAYLAVKFRKQNASSLISLVEVEAVFRDSPLNPK